MIKPTSHRADYHRLPTYNPNARRRERTKVIVGWVVLIAIFLTGVLVGKGL